MKQVDVKDAKKIEQAIKNVRKVMENIPAKVHTAAEITEIVMKQIAAESHQVIDGGAAEGHRIRQEIRFEIRVRIGREFTKMAIAKAKK